MKKLARKDVEHLQVGQDEMWVLLDASQTNGQFSVMERSVAARFQSPPQFHKHIDTDWYCRILKGSLSFHFKDGDQLCNEGDSIFIPRNTLFRWSNPQDARSECEIFYTPGGFEGFFRELIPLLARIQEGSPGRIDDYQENLQAILSIQDKFGIVREPQ